MVVFLYLSEIPPKDRGIHDSTARPGHAGRSSRRIRRPAPANDHRLPTTAPPGASSTSSPSPSETPTPARRTTAPSPGSWTGASSRGLNQLERHQAHPRCRLRRAAPTLSPDRSDSTSRPSAGVSTGWSRAAPSRPTRRRRYRDPNTSSGSAGHRSSAMTRPGRLLESISTK